jgi:sugar transferase (PEP-CTERM/EpsH1 system associated)
MSRPIVVAHVVHSLNVGGLENGLVNLVSAGQPGFRHAIVCLTTEGPLRARVPAGVEVSALGKRPGHDLPAFARLVGRLRALRPDIVHCRNWATFDAVPAARLAGVPVVIHGEHGREVSDPHGCNRRRNLLRKTLGPLVTRFVTVSRDLNDWLVTVVGIPSAKVLTICNGVDTARFGAGDAVAARAALALPLDRPVIGTVGRLDPVKDQAGLIEAFARVRRDHPRALLVIAGDGPCRPQLEALVATLGLGSDVRLLGERKDVPQVLQAMDVFVLPSIAEGISNTVLEAMATGLPVVATRVGGNPELVEDGVSGVLVRPGDRETLAAAIAGYLADPALRTAHGDGSRRLAVSRFGLGTMCAAYADLYTTLASPARAGRA